MNEIYRSDVATLAAFHPAPAVIPSANLFPQTDGVPTPLATDNKGVGCIYDGIDTTTQGNWTNGDPANVVACDAFLD